MGGGTLRTAAKAAFLGGYRSAAAIRRAILPSSADFPLPPSPAVTADEWVIPEREFFGPVPSPEEAMAATMDLKNAFEMSRGEPFVARSGNSGTDGPKEITQATALPDGVANLETSQRKDNSDEILAVASEAPAHVVQAFTLLQKSPEAQDVVASLASDKNVWEAVMKNEKVMQFYKTYETKLTECPGAPEDDTVQIATRSEVSPSAGEVLEDYVQRMKVLVRELVSTLSSIMQDLVAMSNEGQSKGKLRTMVMMSSSSNNLANAPSAFVLLAVASIFVVLLKRA